MRYCEFIESDIIEINQKAHFTSEQQDVFNMLIHKDYSVVYCDIHIYTTLGLSSSKFYKIKKQITKKIERIITDS